MALIFSRKKDETIVIGAPNGPQAVITPVEIVWGSQKVRLAITAPRDVPVHRGEVYEAIYGEAPDRLHQPVDGTQAPADLGYVILQLQEATSRAVKGSPRDALDAVRRAQDGLERMAAEQAAGV